MSPATRALFGTFLAAAYAPCASAHSDEPLAEAITVVDGAIVAQTNFGVVSSEFEGFVCEEAFLGGDSFQVAVLGKDEWIAMSERGIWLTTDGCAFEKVADLPVTPTDITSNLNTKQVVYALNASTDGGIWASGDEGRTWTRVLEEADYQWTGVRFADDENLVITAYDRQNMGAGHLITYNLTAKTSTDALIAEVTYPYLLDARGEQVLWLGRTDTQSVFWGTVEAPKTYTKTLTSWPTAGRVISDTKVVIAGLLQQRGLSEGDLIDGEVVWTDLASLTTALCVAVDAESYLVCAQSRFDEADIMRVAGETLTPEYLFADLQGPRQCPLGSSVQSICPVVWRELARSLGLDPGDEPLPDAGPDTGDDASPEDPIASDPPAASDDSCTSVSSMPMFFSLFGILWMRRKAP